VQTYSPLNLKVRIAAAGLSVIASTLVLGGELGLFEMANRDGLAAQAQASEKPQFAATGPRRVVDASKPSPGAQRKPG